ncbi:Ribose operon repressor [Tritonibacter multivorans]|uniref:Ribose operon repressor n=1 Tax=Tritonibacter multivorans TaxID=928856 RepID=A0A0N7LZS7_9RHOB|nr:LacI family DNA-binding transcriptional regulator [Tritonibacter multivorans]MDA7422085.1 LacI family DNA-binding transcriptional regulator [Tritonibacter multivorans]CUH78497.1 Ribose operon repressor [Tritonibacter multivorans]SFD17678.1 DNA-binding transcriptional regulator, LacI/PurR family [Tritonibacter multivorans]
MSNSKIRNMEEFAAVSGISRPTVSKYFNDPDSVRKSTRSKIEAALEEYDYRPNFYAINQNRRQTKTIGLVVPNLADPFFAAITRIMEGLIVEAGFNPLLLSSHGGPEQELANLESLRAIKPAGVLLAPLGRVSAIEQIAAFAEQIPTVLFDANLEGVGAAFFGSDNQRSIGQIVEYLCRSGEPPVFFEMKHPVNANAYRRQSAYVEAMERLSHDPIILQADGVGWDFEKIGYDEGRRVIAQQSLQSNTVLCSNDRLAIGLLAAAYESGLQVGLGDKSSLRVAGHDDHPFARYTCPSLTTMSQDYEAICRHSVQTILELIDHGEPLSQRQETLFSAQLVMRNSA